MGYSPNGDEDEQQDESMSFFEGKRRSFLKLAGGGLGLSALGGAAISNVGADTGDTFYQVDFVDGESLKNGADLDSAKYADEGRLIRWIWGDEDGNRAEGGDDKYDDDTYGDGDWTISTTNGVEINGNVASVEFEASGGSGGLPLSLVCYDVPSGGSLGWDSTRASEQEIFTATTLPYADGGNGENALPDTGNTLSVVLPTVDAGGLQVYEPFDVQPTGEHGHYDWTVSTVRTGALGVDQWDGEDLKVRDQQLSYPDLHRDGNVAYPNEWAFVGCEFQQPPTDGTTWYSILLNGNTDQQVAITSTTRAEQEGDNHIRFGPGVSGTDDWTLAIGTDPTTDFNFSSSVDDSTGVTHTDGDTVFAVAEVDLSPEEETVNLWINPGVTDSDPTTSADGSASITNTTGADLLTESVQFYDGGAGTSYVDMICVGDTYADVTPTNDPLA